MSKLPKCDRECWQHFHMTGGSHRTDCVLHKYDQVFNALDFMKGTIMAGDKIPKGVVDSLAEFIEQDA